MIQTLMVGIIKYVRYKLIRLEFGFHFWCIDEVVPFVMTLVTLDENARIIISGKEYPHFSCILVKCDKCHHKWHYFINTPAMEPKVEADEFVSYILYGAHHKRVANGF